MFIRSGYSAQTRSSRQPPSITTTLPTWSSVGAITIAPGGSQADRGRLALELGRGQPVEPDQVALGRQAPAGGDDLAAALEHEAVSPSARTAVGRLA